MKLYHIIADDEEWGRSDVRASHRWTLPGIKCRYCGNTWGDTGLSYPSVRADMLPLNDKHGGWPVPNEEYQALVEKVRPLLRPEQLVTPGSEFGPLEGKMVGGKVGDFAWVHWWYLMIREESLAKLKSLGFKSPRVVAPNLSFGNREPVKLLEFEIEALASWDTRKLKKAFECQHCLFFRSGQAPAMILATESFAEKVKDLNLQNIVFEEMKVSK
jgi:uncharacterized double-CXXCG motif protein